MSKKLKLTGFARLLIFMVFFAPLAYLGASYYNGEDGIGNIKKMLGIEATTSSNGSTQDQIDDKTKEIKDLERKIETLKRDVKRLEASKN